MSQHKPLLFSRSQLNLIILASTLLIAVLAWPPARPPQPQLLQINGVQLYHQPLTDEQQGHQRLHLVFSLIDNHSLPSWKAPLFAAIIEQRLQQNSAIAGTRLAPLHDRFSIQFQPSAAFQFAEQIEQLHERLLSPATPAEIEQQLKRLRAQQYLKQQQSTFATEPGFYRLNEAQATVELPRFQQQLLSRSRLHLVLVGELSPTLMGTLENFINRLPLPPDTTAYHQATEPVPADPNVIRLPLPGRSSSTYPLGLMTSRAIDTLTNTDKIAFYSGNHQSWLVWKAQPPLFQPFAVIKDQLQRLTQSQWQQLLDDYQQLLEQPLDSTAQQAQQLEVIARYQLPLDYRQRLAATIADLTPEQMKRFIHQQFSKEHLATPPAAEQANPDNHGQKL